MGPDTGWRLAGVPAEDLEIVGFNGTPSVECGRAIPVARRKSTDAYFRLVLPPGDVFPPTHSAAEIDAFVREGRLTLLTDPLPLRPALLATGAQRPPPQPLILWASRDLFDALGGTRPERADGQPLTWRGVREADPPAWASCASQDAVVHLLDFWGRAALLKADGRLRDPDDQTWGAVRRLADVGLCAAVEGPLRYRLYVRYAAALSLSPEPERVRRTFDLLVHKEFPDSTWERFNADFVTLLQTLGASSRLGHTRVASGNGDGWDGHTTPRHKLRGIAAEHYSMAA